MADSHRSEVAVTADAVDDDCHTVAIGEFEPWSTSTSVVIGIDDQVEFG